MGDFGLAAQLDFAGEKRRTVCGAAAHAERGGRRAKGTGTGRGARSGERSSKWAWIGNNEPTWGSRDMEK